MMICTKDVHNKCPFNSMCDVGCTVADNSECADYIMEVTLAKLKDQGDENGAKMDGGAGNENA